MQWNELAEGLGINPDVLRRETISGLLSAAATHGDLKSLEVYAKIFGDDPELPLLYQAVQERSQEEYLPGLDLLLDE